MSRRFRQPSLFESPAAATVADLFDPVRLTQARVLAGRTKHELAEDLGVSAAAVGQYEAGITAPRPDHLKRLAEVLGYPLAFFAKGRPYVRIDASMAHFRSLRSTRVGQRAKAMEVAEQVWELTNALERHIELPPVNLPAIGSEKSARPIGPESAAREVRKFWGIEAGPFRHAVRTLEIHGVVVSLVSMDEDVARVDAFSTSIFPRPLVILTPDRANDVYRHRFTACHELGHLLLHRNVIPGDLEQEKEADRFAAELLAPAAEIADELPARFRLQALDEISRRWGVSVKSLVRRCRELGIISDASARRSYVRLQQATDSGLLRPEPITKFQGETPVLLLSAFELAEQHGLELKTLAAELAWPHRRVRQLLGQPDPRPSLRLV
ncbi:XRE family transcriptional regulator [Dactylosporangium sp. CA-092794]|uniref:XRE family transcriptional regulator n=1 Tax=Dactylosporangium sp. CA-092794 TaxID=3239929 RepID=UPI003D89FA8A